MGSNKQSVVNQSFIDFIAQLKASGFIRSNADFCQKVGLNPNTITEIKSGRQSVTTEILYKTSRHFPLDLNALFDNALPYESSAMVSSIPRIEYITTKAKAGYPVRRNDEAYLKRLPHYELPDLANDDRVYRIFEVEGNSMNPTLYHGDRVVCERVDLEDIRHGRVHTVVTENDIVIKRIADRSEDGAIVLLSDNKEDMASYSLDIENIVEIWYVKCRITYNLKEPSELFYKVFDLEADVAVLKELVEFLSDRLKAGSGNRS